LTQRMTRNQNSSLHLQKSPKLQIPIKCQTTDQNGNCTTEEKSAID